MSASHCSRRAAARESFTLDDYLDALDTLHDAQMYLARQFDKRMSPDRARAHFGARFTLSWLQRKVDEQAQRKMILEANESERATL